MGTNTCIIDEFFKAYCTSDFTEVEKHFSDNIEIKYSTIGFFKGKESVIEALTWNQNFTIHHTTITNTMSYIDDNEIEKVALIAHHLFANENGSELFPLLFGGKYIFEVDVMNKKLLSICYAQEYQAENILFIRDWTLAKKVPDIAIAKMFDLDKAKQQALKLESNKEICACLTRIFFWAFDLQNSVFAKSLVNDDIHMKRYKTMSYGTFESTGKETISEFITNTKDYYAMDQHSISIRNIEEDDNTITVIAAHLVPHRSGTKKLNINTKYHSFYDEDIIVTFKKINSTYLIDDISMKKIADVHYNGFAVLHAE